MIPGLAWPPKMRFQLIVVMAWPPNMRFQLMVVIDWPHCDLELRLGTATWNCDLEGICCRFNSFNGLFLYVLVEVQLWSDLRPAGFRRL